MNYLVLIEAVILLCVVIVSVLLCKGYRKYKTAYKQEHEKLLGVQEEYSKLIEAYNIKKSNKEKANAKTDALHSGKLSADDILPKRKN